MLTTILFDNDGVLVDTEALFYESCRVMMRQFDYELGEAEFAELSLSRGMSLADIIVGAGHSREAAKDARRERDLYYDRMLQERSASLVVDGVREVLAELHRDYRGLGLSPAVRKCTSGRFTPRAGLRSSSTLWCAIKILSITNRIRSRT